MSPVYLDNNASTRPAQRVIAAMLPLLTDCFGNPSSKHEAGMMAAAAVQKARKQVANLIGASSESEIVFVSGGTEADNLAILSGLDNRPDRDEIVVSVVEHPAVLALCDHLERSRGITVHRIGVDSLGRIDLEEYSPALGPRTAVAIVMWANNETGNVHPIAHLARLAHAHGALFFTDAVQAAGRVPIDLSTCEADFLSLSSHKFHGPKGVGALFVRKGLKVHSLIRGGRQERGRRAGTENVPGIVGMGEAAELAVALLATDALRQEALRERLVCEILRSIPGATVLGDPRFHLPNTLCVAFEDIESDDAITLLSREGVWVSSGSACSSGSQEPSHVLRAMRVPFESIRGAVRLSLSRESLEDEVDRAAKALAAVVERLRGLDAHLHVA
ncbi:MAG: cysteine desulfurase NifS [Fibrobacterota bacterium]|jgi:cysteine desulfurase